MEYVCPRDGSTLHVPDAVIWDWQTASLLCDVCSTGFWLSELQGDSLKLYDAKNRTFRGPVWVAVQQERTAHMLRGHGVSSKVQALLSPRQLELHRKRNGDAI